VRALAVSGLVALGCLSVGSCGGDDATTPIDDASIDAKAPSDAAAPSGDGSIGDVPVDNKGDEVAADVALDAIVYDAAVVDATGEGNATDGDEATLEDAASVIDADARTPSVADNPPIPAGYKVIPQSQVTPEMTTWAVMILNDATTHPMFDTVTKTFDELTLLLRVEWHPPDFQNSTVHRGVTLYVPI